MKKILAMFLALTMGCTMLAACGDKDSSDSSSKEDKKNSTPVRPDFSQGITIEKEEENKTDERLFEALAKEITESKTCTMSVDTNEDGFVMMMYLSMDEKNTYVDMDLLGIKMTILSTADGSYVIDKVNKKYYTDTTGTMSEQLGGDDLLDDFTELEGITYVGSYIVTIDGKEYPMEKYKDEFDTESCYIFDGENDVVACKNGDTDYAPLLLSKTPDTSKFSIDGYTEMSDEEFTEWYGNLMNFTIE